MISRSISETIHEEDHESSDHSTLNSLDNRYLSCCNIHEKSPDTLEALKNHLQTDDYVQALWNAQREMNRKRVSVEKKGKFEKSFYSLVSKYKRIGLRHLLMIGLVAFYAITGAVVFYNIESPYEIEMMNKRAILMESEFGVLAEEFIYRIDNNITLSVEMVKDSYIKLLNIEGKYQGSTFYKAEDPQNLLWSFTSAMFFSISVYTTIGWGIISCSTALGKVMTLLYALITVPLTFVVYRDLGQWILIHITKFYARMLIKLRNARNICTSDNEKIRLPIKFAVFAVCAYLLFATVFVYNYDAHFGTGSIEFFPAFYFSCITMPAIGLGDVMPVYATYSPVVAFLFVFGMPFARVVNRVSYLSIENVVFGVFTLLEQKMESSGGQPQAELQSPLPLPPPQARRPRLPMRRILEVASEMAENEELHHSDHLLTIHSIATMIRERKDVYSGDFGRINLRRPDVDE